MKLYKICKKCLEKKDISLFHKAKFGKFGVRTVCKKCRRDEEDKDVLHKRQRNWYIKNRKRALKKAEKYRKNNRKLLNKKSKEYRKNNKSKVAITKHNYWVKNKDKISIYCEEWKCKNKERVREFGRISARQRRARQENLCENYGVAEERITLKVFGKKCFKCKDDKNIQIDHHCPLSKGFALSVTNAVPLCKICNLSKGTKMPEQFYTPKQINKIDKLFKLAKIIEEKDNE
jgi:hypothetical protein